ncbi:MAG: hypothetical protein Q8940_02150 [Bacteroidota bacterium]|nr:hypothetical protein [Bacteroidota bacterium]
MIKEEIAKINKLLIKKYGLPIQKNPNPDPVDILIATILSKNTNDRNSYRSFVNLKKEFQSWEEVAKSDLLLIEKPIRYAGKLFRIVLFVQYSSCALMSTRICLKMLNTRKVHSCFWIT